MTAFTRVLGAGLVVLGVGAYLATGTDSPTALLPAVLGVVLLVCGALAGREALRRHAIHAALAVALLGAVGSMPMVADLPALLAGEDVDRPVAVVGSTVTAVSCLVYVGAGVGSFIRARRAT